MKESVRNGLSNRQQTMVPEHQVVCTANVFLQTRLFFISQRYTLVIVITERVKHES
jgi:hypothetical protein